MWSHQVNRKAYEVCKDLQSGVHRITVQPCRLSDLRL